jgi:glycosyltransferase involved in cell wall biosynthesis
MAAMTNPLPLVVIVQSALPDYREAVVGGLRRSLRARLLVVTGESGFEPTVRLSRADAETIVVRNVYLARRRMLWQRGSIRRAVRADVSVVDLNPRVLSTWVILVVRRTLRRPTLAWGHAWSRSGRRSWTERLRSPMRRLASDIVVYTHAEADQLAPRMRGKRIHAAPNGLYSERCAIPQTDLRQARDVICVGRLVAAKKPRLLVAAFARAVPRLPADTRLVFVGDGELLPLLEDDARELGVEDRVRFVGHVSEFDELRSFYWNSLVSVSPGYAGLSLIQSHWFGVPMIVARDEPHAPEIEAAVEGENVLFVESNSRDALGDAIVGVYETSAVWLARGPSIAASCVERYAVESTVRSFAAAIRAHLT